MLEPTDLARYQRETMAMIRKAAADDPDSLAAVYDTLTDGLSAMPRAVTEQMTRDGYSWADVAKAFRMHRSTAFRRFATVNPERVDRESLRRLASYAVS